MPMAMDSRIIHTMAGTMSRVLVSHSISMVNSVSTIEVPITVAVGTRRT